MDVTFDGTSYLAIYSGFGPQPGLDRGFELSVRNPPYLFAVRYGVDGARIGDAMEIGRDVLSRYEDADTVRRRFQVAALSGRYLAVYRSEFLTRSLHDIGATLFEADGTVVNRFLITSADRSQDFPVVTTDGTNFLVAWREPVTRSGADDEPSVFLARINRDGVNLDPDGQNLGLENDDGPISIAYGRGALLVRAGNQARTWSPDGSLSDPVSLMGAGPVVFDGSVFLHAYITASREVEVERITSALRVSRVTGVFADTDEIAIASTGSGVDVFARSEVRVEHRHVSRDLRTLTSRARVGGADTRCLRAAGSPGQSLLIHCDPDIFWAREAAQARRVSRSGDVLDEEVSLVNREQADQTALTIATSGSEYLVTYTDGRDGAFASRLSLAGSHLEELVLDAEGEPPTVAFGAGAYMTAWFRDGRLRWARVRTDGRVVGSGSTALAGDFARIASFGDEFALVVRRGTDVLLYPMTRDGVLGSSVRLGTCAYTRRHAIEVAGGGGRVGVSWWDGERLEARVFDASLRVLTNEVLAVGFAEREYGTLAPPVHPVVAGRDQFLFSWEFKSESPGVVRHSAHGRRIGFDGSLRDAEDIIFLLGALDPVVAFDGLRFVAIGDWRPRFGSRLRVHYINPDGTTVGSDPRGPLFWDEDVFVYRPRAMGGSSDGRAFALMQRQVVLERDVRLATVSYDAPLPEPMDAGVSDTGPADAGVSDTGAMDTGAMDTGDASDVEVDAEPDGGMVTGAGDCGCRVSARTDSADLALVWAALGFCLVWTRRRRRAERFSLMS